MTVKTAAKIGDFESEKGNMRELSIITYHYIRDLRYSRFPNIKGLDFSLFREQLEFIVQNFNVIKMEDLIRAANGNGSLPDNAALLTFDDGYLDHYTYALPLLDEYGVQGSFFFTCKGLQQNELLDVNKIQLLLASVDISELYLVLLDKLNIYRGTEFYIPENDELIKAYAVPYFYDDKETGFVKRILQTALPKDLRTMITDELFRQYVCAGIDERTIAKEMYCGVSHAKLMKKYGMFVGVHGYAHEWLGNCEREVYESDIQNAVDEMADMGLIDKTAWVMNYPYGSWNNGVVEFIRDKGCILGLTTKKAVASLDRDDMLLLPRIDTNEYPPKSMRYRTIVA